MDWLRHDLRHALRMLAARPGWTSLAVATLAIGLAVNTVAFSAVNALVLKPLRFPDANSAGWLFAGPPRNPFATTSLPVFEAIDRQAATVDRVAAEGRVPLALEVDGAAEQIWSLLVSPDYFSFVRPAPIHGRVIAGADGRQADAVPVVASERFWRRRLQAETDLAAIQLILSRHRAVVVGVLPDSYQGPGGLFEPDVWVPLASRRALGLPERYDAADTGWLALLARPAAGSSREAMTSEVAALAAGLSPPAGAERVAPQFVPFADRHPEARSLGSVAIVGMLAIGLVLLIACFNVAGLVLARSLERRRDLGMRSALGASRFRLARLLVTEGLVLALSGGAAALVVASWAPSLLSAFSLPAPIPQRLHFVTDWRVITFAAALVGLAAVLPALVPLWQVARADLARWTRIATGSDTTAAGHRRTRRLFVGVQIAGSTIFLASALVFASHFARERRADIGFDTTRLAVLEVNPARHGYAGARSRDAVLTLVGDLAATPGVAAVSVADVAPPYLGNRGSTTVSVDGQDCRSSDCPSARESAVDARFFQTMGIGVLEGRSFTASGTADGDAAVVNATAARRLWPNASAVGRSIRLGNGRPWLTVIGVVADIAPRGSSTYRAPAVFRLLRDEDFEGTISVMARTSAEDATAALAPVRRALHRLDARLPPTSLQTMDERMALSLWPTRTAAGVFGTCGAAALLLSTIGLFGVTYFAVSARQREFGVRLALGASRQDVRRLVLGEAVRLALPGIILGVAAAVLLGLAGRSILFGLDTSAPAPYLAAAAVQAVVTLAASWSPAARAARSNPLAVLRGE